MQGGSSGVPIFAGLALAFVLAGHARAEDRTLIYNGLERRYVIDKPKAGASGARLPVVIVLHGGGGSPENAKRMTGFAERPFSKGAILVYPGGTGPFPRLRRLKTWNAGHCCGYAMEHGIDDVGFIAVLIDRLIAHDRADPKRVYVTGMSNGAMMAHRLGIALSDRIAAVAPVVGGLFGDEPRPASAVSAIIVNGRLDKSVPLSGGATGGRFPRAWDGTPLRPAAYQGAFWAAADACGPAPETTQAAGGALTIERYACPAGRDVVRYIVNDGGHAWPGGKKGSRRGDEPSTALDATGVIWDFFARHGR